MINIYLCSLFCLSAGEYQTGEPNQIPSPAESETAGGTVPVQPEQPQPKQHARYGVIIPVTEQQENQWLPLKCSQQPYVNITRGEYLKVTC